MELPHHTEHRILRSDARTLGELEEDSVDLVVTSPPYPLISMWDRQFAELSPAAGEALERGDGWAAFEAMHLELDAVWAECRRVLRPGCFLCINIGDAVRTLGGEFLLYPNHSRILSAAAKLGFRPLPPIIWYKPANSPTKFMGSGMLPAGAYVTLEHEYVLLLRNGPPRRFRSEAEKVRRRQSALFWEERNRWFANLWELRGTRQGMQEEEMRARSAAFPFELPFRLIQMYSLIGDTVLDPFLGVGTTMRAAAASARHSVGAEMVPEMAGEAEAQLLRRAEQDAARMPARLEAHFDFLREYRSRGKTPRHSHAEHGYPVISSQERDLRLLKTVQLKSEKEGSVTAVHREVEPQGHAEL